MAVAAAAGTGLLDLEKELTCSICTEILYQPLTLLDCLHTFCGSCLKLWFAWQASNTSNSNPYTCPSCRASVRGTRPDAKITTLLDMYLQANPDKGRSQQEKEDTSEKYTVGEDVVPRLSARVASRDGRRGASRSDREQARLEEEDRRMVEEVREMSLREGSAVRSERGYERGGRHERRRSRDGRTDASSAEDDRARARQIEHQSSLRSLISSSDVDSTEMEEEILRQIMEEGLLDGIDLQNLDTMQEDELSERIADAYRRRHHRSGGQSGQGRSRASSQDNRRREERERERDRERDRRRQPPTSAPREPRDQSTGAAQQNSRRHARSTSTAETSTTSSHPPISRPHLFEAYPAGQQQRGHRRRTLSETRRQTSSGMSSAADGARNEATRSATDLSQRPRMTEQRDRRPSDVPSQTRRSTEPRPRRLSDNSRPSGSVPVSAIDARRRDSPRDSPRGTGSPLLSPASATFPTTHMDSPTSIHRIPRSNPTDSPRLAATVVAQDAVNRSRPSSSSSAGARPRPAIYPEPSVSCDACAKQDIQYDLHYNCAVCKEGAWNLCWRCYRSGKGCLHYFGFGNAAWQRFQQRATPGSELPHALVGAQYKHPPPESLQHSAHQKMTTDNPATRLTAGAFCYICSAPANDSFWHCGTCNDGEWGYCNNCVNTGRTCTHPLLPLAHVSTTFPPPPSPNNPHSSANPPSSSTQPHTIANFAPLPSPSHLLSFPPTNLLPSGQFRPLTITNHCSICSTALSPRQTRFHCYQCASGDYDICAPCYAGLAESGRITRDNGERGWRRCLRGHRMVVIFFDEASGSRERRRVVVRDLVGGRFLADDGDGSALAGNGHQGAQQNPLSPTTTTTSPPLEAGTYSWIEGSERKTRRVERRFLASSGGGGGGGGGEQQQQQQQQQVFPPDGGVGIRLLGLWTWLPQEGVKDELSFPRGAEITEALEISAEWYQGTYAGAKGVFPSNHVRVIEVVGM